MLKDSWDVLLLLPGLIFRAFAVNQEALQVLCIWYSFLTIKIGINTPAIYTGGKWDLIDLPSRAPRQTEFWTYTLNPDTAQPLRAPSQFAAIGQPAVLHITAISRFAKLSPRALSSSPRATVGLFSFFLALLPSQLLFLFNHISRAVSKATLPLSRLCRSVSALAITPESPSLLSRSCSPGICTRILAAILIISFESLSFPVFEC